MRWLGLLLVIVGLGIGAYTLKDYKWIDHRPTQEIFKEVWQNDLNTLQASQKLPEGWSELKMVEFVTTSNQLRELLNFYKPDFHINDAGSFKLEVFLYPWTDGGDSGFIVQYHLIDMVTNNTIWELGRTLKVGRPIN